MLELLKSVKARVIKSFASGNSNMVQRVKGREEESPLNGNGSQIYIFLTAVFWNHFSGIPSFYSDHCPSSLFGLRIIQLNPNRKISF